LFFHQLLLFLLLLLQHITYAAQVFVFFFFYFGQANLFVAQRTTNVDNKIEVDNNAVRFLLRLPLMM